MAASPAPHDRERRDAGDGNKTVAVRPTGVDKRGRDSPSSSGSDEQSDAERTADDDEAGGSTGGDGHVDVPKRSPPSDVDAVYQYGGSRKGRAKNVERNHEERATRLFNDFFAASSVYGPVAFRRKFRMRQSVFLKIARGVLQVDGNFALKRNALHQPGLSTFQKVALALRVLFFGRTSEGSDEYVQVGDSTSSVSANQFCVAVVVKFASEYLHPPVAAGVGHVLDEKAGLGNPRQCFATIQDACVNDVERGFALLQHRFGIVKNPPRAWSKAKMKDIMSTCIILHNLIMEDEAREDLGLLQDLDFEDVNGQLEQNDLQLNAPSPKRQRVHVDPWAYEVDPNNVNGSSSNSASEV
ncbi:Ribosomal protein [Globisporangium polare]